MSEDWDDSNEGDFVKYIQMKKRVKCIYYGYKWLQLHKSLKI